MLAGIGFVASFLFAPLHQAKLASALIGISALWAILTRWMWLVRTALFEVQQTSEGAEGVGSKFKQNPAAREVVIWLLFALVSVLTTACVAFLFEGTPWSGRLMSLMTMGFLVVYAIFYAMLGHRVETAAPLG